jgi:hypothetical protein
MTAPGARIQEVKEHAVRSKKPIFLLGDEVPDDFDIGSLVGKATFCAYSPTWLLETGLKMGIKPHLIVCGNRADIATNHAEWIELIRRVGKETNIIFADPIISRYIKSREDVEGCRIIGFSEVARTNPHFFDEDAKLHENSPLWFAMKVCAMLRHRPIVILDNDDCDEKTKEAEDDGVDIFGAKFL